MRRYTVYIVLNETIRGMAVYFNINVHSLSTGYIYILPTLFMELL